ncbi:amidohydrolase family protein [Streptomyces sp. NA04227]|uniref:amidohydrolase family protein n=1 Tax=Streptomyces sp. NA04227 TaxID=2742136 RepID=UPI00158FD941|nr:amidohydrolase family protein [Streptomyces sp. NA04227]QKW10047.1 amidohydrolase family protein [Streptomyces sp. NA04227]
MTQVPLIDAHHHVWDLGVRDQGWITGAELAPLRRDFTLRDLAADTTAAGAEVEATVVVQTVTVAAETPELLHLAAHPPAGAAPVAGVVGWTDLTDPAIEDRLAALRELPGGDRLVGIRHQVQGEPDPRWLLRPDVLRGLRAVAAAGLVHDLVILPRQLPAAVDAALAVPELLFVLDHLGKPPVAAGTHAPWAADLCRLASLPNTTAKLSGLVTEADWTSWTTADLRPYVETALTEFGPDRLMFGSDWPVCTLAASYGEVLASARELTAGLSSTERDAVFGATATRVYGLGSG